MVTCGTPTRGGVHNPGWDLWSKYGYHAPTRGGVHNTRTSILEEGGKEGKRGPFRGQNFCGSPSQVDGHGWPRSRVEGGLTRVPGRRAAKKNKKNNHKNNNGIYSVSAKNGKSSKKEF